MHKIRYKNFASGSGVVSEENINYYYEEIPESARDYKYFVRMFLRPSPSLIDIDTKEITKQFSLNQRVSLIKEIIIGKIQNLFTGIERAFYNISDIDSDEYDAKVDFYLFITRDLYWDISEFYSNTEEERDYIEDHLQVAVGYNFFIYTGDVVEDIIPETSVELNANELISESSELSYSSS